MLCLIVAALVGAAPGASPSPSPTPVPTSTPAPPVTVGGDFTAYAFHTNGVNATGAADVPSGADLPNRADLSNLLLNLSAGTGNLRLTATVGEYGFPTVGTVLTPDLQAGTNTELYTVLPVAALQFAVNGHLSVAAGKFAALLGQESPFTFQNANIERGLVWAMEPTISRGVQANYANGAWTLTLQENDAYYSGHDRAFEGLIGWAPSSSTNLQFAAIVPGANAAPNPTVAVGNKAEYDLMYTRQIGKLQLLPYVLLVESPSSTALGYRSTEHATAAVALATWTFSTPFSLAVRFENARNASAVSDASANADLLGYGPGSRAQTITLTPALHFPASNTVLRLEYSNVSLSSFASGLGFGPAGTAGTQNRYGFEFGVMH